MGTVRAIALGIAVVMTAAINGQTLTFAAASVKRNTTNGQGQQDFIIVRPGQLLTQYATLRELIQAAYGVDENQVVDAPRWIDTDHFEVNAAVPRRIDG